MKLSNQFKKLETQTKSCLICMKNIKKTTYFSFINSDCCLCEECMKSLIPVFHNFRVGKYKAMAIYDYDEVFQKLLYQYKGCYDFALTPIFLNRFIAELKIIYKGYSLICAPSFYTEDRKREFNHVFSIFSDLKLPILPVITKTQNIKQANLRKNERNKIQNILKLSHVDLIKNKKILIVDDVYTTGSTIKAMINLIERYMPKTIKILVLAKTIDLIKRIEKNA